MTWRDPEDIALALCDLYPEQNPLEVRFTDLRRRVLALPGFDDDPAASSEPILEAIQMAWLDEWQDRQ
jgi:FeS assembly protein IscX